MRKLTIYEALRQKCGRAPTNAELKAEVARIIHEGTCEAQIARRAPRRRRR